MERQKARYYFNLGSGPVDYLISEMGARRIAQSQDECLPTIIAGATMDGLYLI